MTTLAPQFQTQSLDLELKKGESAQFSVAVTDYDLDLRGCLIFAEIRRTAPGYELINNFTGVATSGSNTIQVRRYPATDDKAQLLKSLPVRTGDLITLEGSGITGSKVIAVTDSQIVASGSATRTISEGRVLVRSLSLTSFTAIPYLPNISITGSGSSSGATSMTVANITRTIPSGTTIVFNDSGTAKSATLTADLTPGSTTAYVSALAAAIGSDATAIVGASTVIVMANAAASATSITASALSVPMPANTVLNFATRTGDGWQFVGSAKLTMAVVASATTLTVAALSAAIPANAIAWFGTQPFNSFLLAIDPADTQFLESGDYYGYDVICRQSDGYTIRLIQGSVKLTDHWSDGV